MRIRREDGLMDVLNLKVSPIGPVEREYGGWTQNGWEIERRYVMDR